jgi:hypothetical protein
LTGVCRGSSVDCKSSTGVFAKEGLSFSFFESEGDKGAFNGRLKDTHVGESLFKLYSNWRSLTLCLSTVSTSGCCLISKPLYRRIYKSFVRLK